MSWIAKLASEGDSFSWEFSHGKYKLKQREVHIVPEADLVMHTLSRDCACQPQFEVDAGPGIISHNSWDQREMYEVLKEV